MLSSALFGATFTDSNLLLRAIRRVQPVGGLAGATQYAAALSAPFSYTPAALPLAASVDAAAASLPASIAPAAVPADRDGLLLALLALEKDANALPAGLVCPLTNADALFLLRESRDLGISNRRLDELLLLTIAEHARPKALTLALKAAKVKTQLPKLGPDRDRFLAASFTAVPAPLATTAATAAGSTAAAASSVLPPTPRDLELSLRRVHREGVVQQREHEETISRLRESEEKLAEERKALLPRLRLQQRVRALELRCERLTKEKASAEQRLRVQEETIQEFHLACDEEDEEVQQPEDDPDFVLFGSSKKVAAAEAFAAGPDAGIFARVGRYWTNRVKTLYVLLLSCGLAPAQVPNALRSVLAVIDLARKDVALLSLSTAKRYQHLMLNVSLQHAAAVLAAAPPRSRHGPH